MVTFRGYGFQAILAFFASVVIIALGARTILGSSAADIPTSIWFGIALLASAVVTAALAWLGTRDGGPTRGRHEVGGLALERVAAVESVIAVVAIAIGRLG